MTLPVSGAISFNAINVELGVAGTTTANINQASYRTLANITTPGTTISLSNFYGKTKRIALNYTFSASTANASLNLSGLSGYVAGITDITVTINSGVYLYATSNSNPGLNLTGGTTGDTLTIVNNGFIIGQGGTGGGYYSTDSPSTIINNYLISGGGTALSIPINATIQNNSYIAGGGGGGGGAGIAGTGGGGAGGGAGGVKYVVTSGTTYLTNGGTGGGIGSSGGNGGGGAATNINTGGGGGRVLPGTNITQTATLASYTATSTGGGANNEGASSAPTFGTAANNTLNAIGLGGSGGGTGGLIIASGFYAQYAQAGGGGGGWGASGGPGRVTNNAIAYSGASGGNCVALNGKTVTWSATGNRYGAIS